MLEKKIYPNPQVRQFLSTSYVGVLLQRESEEGERLMRQFGMPGIPALFVMDAKGQVISKSAKAPDDPASFIELVTEMSKGHSF
jgi:hypothetical protein